MLFPTVQKIGQKRCGGIRLVTSRRVSENKAKIGRFMSSAHLLRLQIEAALADRIPSALTPLPRVIHPTAPTGIEALDEQLGGGLPLGTISELAGPECSGRTSLALSFIAGMTQAGRVCAWVDVSDALDPESAAAAGVDLERLLWVRCGREAKQLMLLGYTEKRKEGQENSRQIAPGGKAENHYLAGEKQPSLFPRCSEPEPRGRRKSREVVVLAGPQQHEAPLRKTHPEKPWVRLDQALRVTDLLLQAGGFNAIVLDMGSIAPEYTLRVPLATWFRYRAAAERTQASMVLLTQQACTKSSAGLVLYMEPGGTSDDGSTVFTGSEYRIRIARERFTKVVDFARKPPQSECGWHGNEVHWQSRASWTGRP